MTLSHWFIFILSWVQVARAVHTRRQWKFVSFCPCDLTHEIKQFMRPVVGTKFCFSLKRACHTKGIVAATCRLVCPDLSLKRVNAASLFSLMISFLRPQVSSSCAACTHRVAIQTGNQLVSWHYAVHHSRCVTNATRELGKTRAETEGTPVLTKDQGTMTRHPTLASPWNCTEGGDRSSGIVGVVFVRLYLLI